MVLIALAIASAASVAKERNSSKLVFEGTLLAHTAYPNMACGIFFFTQAGRYRIDRVITGSYDGVEIIVAHSACGGDAFGVVAVGEKVRVEARSDNLSSWQAAELGYSGKSRTIRARYYADDPPTAVE
jgi:hypothetical protein